jgi:hypothetical protein
MEVKKMVSVIIRLGKEVVRKLFIDPMIIRGSAEEVLITEWLEKAFCALCIGSVVA